MEDSMCEPVLIIPACGNSQRFRDQNITIPKGLISFKLNGIEQPMIKHAVPETWEDRTYVIVKNTEVDLFEYYLPGMKIIPMPVPSNGQAHTVAFAAEFLKAPCLIINSDNRFTFDQIDKLMSIKADVGTLVFKTKPDHSFGYVDKFPLFERCVEKKPISEYALAGAFYFKKWQDIVENFESDSKEVHLSKVLDNIKKPKQSVIIKRKEMYDFGTPEQLKQFLTK